jgi:hypothetical protein
VNSFRGKPKLKTTFKGQLCKFRFLWYQRIFLYAHVYLHEYSFAVYICIMQLYILKGICAAVVRTEWQISKGTEIYTSLAWRNNF